MSVSDRNSVTSTDCLVDDRGSTKENYPNIVPSSLSVKMPFA